MSYLLFDAAYTRALRRHRPPRRGGAHRRDRGVPARAAARGPRAAPANRARIASRGAARQRRLTTRRAAAPRRGSRGAPIDFFLDGGLASRVDAAPDPDRHSACGGLPAPRSSQGGTQHEGDASPSGPGPALAAALTRRRQRARLGQHDQPEHVVDHRPRRDVRTVPRRRVRRLDLRRLPRLDLQRREARGAHGRRRVRLEHVEHRHRGDPPHQVGRRSRATSTTTRSSASARTCRHATRAS